MAVSAAHLFPRLPSNRLPVLLNLNNTERVASLESIQEQQLIDGQYFIYRFSCAVTKRVKESSTAIMHIDIAKRLD